MPKEFLHEVVKKRERSIESVISHDAIRRQYEQMVRSTGIAATLAATDPWSQATGYGYSSDYARAEDGWLIGQRLISTDRSSNPIVELMTPERVEGHATMSGMPSLSANVVEFNLRADASRGFRRTDVRIGGVPNSLLDRIVVGQMLRHAHAMLHNHSCFPDYNVTGTRSVSSAIEYSCAWCRQRFDGRTE